MVEAHASGSPVPPDGIAPQQAAQTGQEPEWTWLARIRRPQGRKGEVFADILTDFPEKFAERRQLWLLRENAKAGSSAAPREVALANHWLHKGGVVLQFGGIDSITDAETMAGLIVAIPRTERAALTGGEVYIGDLIGCALVDVAGAQPNLIGEIEDVDRTAGPVALLVVRAPGSTDEVLVPFAKSYMRKIDLEARRVEMALPEGLIDLNATKKS